MVQSWIRQVTIVDADRGLEFAGGGYNTATQVTLTTHWRQKRTQAPSVGTTGQYGIVLSRKAQDTLVTESELQTVFEHNLAVAAGANGNVFAGILSEAGRFVHADGAPYENLYTEIVLTDNAREVCDQQSAAPPGVPAGARATFWNVVTLGDPFPPRYDAHHLPQLNLIGIDQWATTKTAAHEWIERWPGGLTSPANLYVAQLQRRHAQGATPGAGPAGATARAVETEGDSLSAPMPSAQRCPASPPGRHGRRRLGNSGTIRTYSTNPLLSDTGPPGSLATLPAKPARTAQMVSPSIRRGAPRAKPTQVPKRAMS